MLWSPGGGFIPDISNISKTHWRSFPSNSSALPVSSCKIGTTLSLRSVPRAPGFQTTNVRTYDSRGAPKKPIIPFTVHRTVPGMTGRLGIQSHSKMERLRLRNVGCFSGFWTLPFRQKELLPMEGHGAPINSLIYGFTWSYFTLYNSIYNDPRGLPWEVSQSSTDCSFVIYLAFLDTSFPKTT